MLFSLVTLIVWVPLTAWLAWECWQFAKVSRVATIASAVVAAISLLYTLSLLLVVAHIIPVEAWSPIMRVPGTVLWPALALSWRAFRKFAIELNGLVGDG